MFGLKDLFRIFLYLFVVVLSFFCEILICKVMKLGFCIMNEVFVFLISKCYDIIEYRIIVVFIKDKD